MNQPKAPLSRLFDPSSVAVIGASSAPEKPGYQMMKSLAPFDGAVYPVNPRAETILGRQAYPDIAALPEAADLIALVVPPDASAAILEQAADKGVGAALMVSGGFSETGEDGKRAQQRILDICRAGGIRLLGPNTSGFMVPPRRLFATFLPPAAELRPGGIGIVAQSGGVNITAAFLAHADGLGLRMAVGIGNGADVGVVDTIDYLADDPETDAIAVHLEGIANGRRLFETIQAASAKKPLVALPVGRADLGGFAESHTGALMGSFALTCAALRQAGAVVVDTMSDLVDAAHLLSKARLSPAADPGIGILTGQAGPGLLMTDTLRDAGITVPEVSETTVAKISTLLPPMTYIRNPVDTGRPLASFGDVLRALAEDAAIDAIMVYALLEPEAVDPLIHVGDVAGEIAKPVIYGTCGVPGDILPIMTALEDRGVAAFDSPDRMARAVRALAEDSRHRWRIGKDKAVSDGKTATPLSGPLDEDAAKTLIEAAGIATPARRVCATREEAVAAFAALGAPVVVKVLDAGITHKTEVGGVHVGVVDTAALTRALDSIDAIQASGAKRRYLVEATAPPGVEVIIGGVNDASFGPTVLLGLGGVTAEALGDATLRVAPLSATEAAAMVEDLKGKALLDGWRGATAVDRKALSHAIAAVAALMAAHPEIRELDLNPVRLYPDGLLALDALVVI